MRDEWAWYAFSRGCKVLVIRGFRERSSDAVTAVEEDDDDGKEDDVEVEEAGGGEEWNAAAE